MFFVLFLEGESKTGSSFKSTISENTKQNINRIENRRVIQMYLKRCCEPFIVITVYVIIWLMWSNLHRLT